MHLASFDLNLLVALDALVSECHVGRAARRIGLSQPATSHALARLRAVVGDPLLVRVGSRMELTPRARALRAPLAQELERLRQLFVTDSFDPRTSRRRFALAMSDHVVDLVIPPLLARIASEAPQVRLEVTQWPGPASMTADLARSIDLVIVCTGEGFAGFHRQRLFGDSDAVGVRRGHPLGARLRRLDVFRAAGHIAVVTRGRDEDPIDEWLRGHSVERRIALVVPSYLQALHMAARTDLVAFVPRRLIEALAGPLALAVVPPPLDPGSEDKFMFHPTHTDADPGSIWLRDLVLSVGRRLDGRSRPHR